MRKKKTLPSYNNEGEGNQWNSRQLRNELIPCNPLSFEKFAKNYDEGRKISSATDIEKTEYSNVDKRMTLDACLMAYTSQLKIV